MKIRASLIVALVSINAASATPVVNRGEPLQPTPLARQANDEVALERRILNWFWPSRPTSTSTSSRTSSTTTSTTSATSSAPPTSSPTSSPEPSSDAGSSSSDTGEPGTTQPPTTSSEPPASSTSSSAAPAETSPVGAQADAQGPYVSSLSGEYLYVWAGAEGRQLADRLVTLDFSRNSPTYGKVVSQTVMPPPVSSGNEPHHCGLSADGQTLICGGLLSVLKSQDEIFVFSLADPAMPKLITTKKGRLGSIPDDFYPISDNTFLLTEMGSATGGSPGRIARVNTMGDVLSEHPENPPGDFNPHGIDVRADLNLMTTCDYIDPASSLASSPGQTILRSSVRVWNLDSLEMTKTIRLPSGTGSMDCKLLKHHPGGLGFVGGSCDGKIYLYDAMRGTAQQVINLNADLIFILVRLFTPKVLAQYMQVSADDQRLYIPYATNTGNIFIDSGLYSGVAVYDISNPYRPRFIQNQALPSGAGPHLSHLMGNRLIITDYFLDQDNLGKIHLDGDHHVRSYLINSQGRLSRDNRFDVDFNRLINGVRLRPHGMASNMRY